MRHVGRVLNLVQVNRKDWKTTRCRTVPWDLPVTGKYAFEGAIHGRVSKSNRIEDFQASLCMIRGKYGKTYTKNWHGVMISLEG